MTWEVEAVYFRSDSYGALANPRASGAARVPRFRKDMGDLDGCVPFRAASFGENTCPVDPQSLSLRGQHYLGEVFELPCCS